MKTEAYLEQYHSLGKRINRLSREEITMRRYVTRLKNKNLASQDIIEKIEQRLENLQSYIDKLYRFAAPLKQQITETIQSVESREYQDLLLDIYINCHTFDQIASMRYLNLDTVERCHQAAIAMILLPEKPLNIREI